MHPYVEGAKTNSQTSDSCLKYICTAFWEVFHRNADIRKMILISSYSDIFLQ